MHLSPRIHCPDRIMYPLALYMKEIKARFSRMNLI